MYFIRAKTIIQAIRYYAIIGIGLGVLAVIILSFAVLSGPIIAASIGFAVISDGGSSTASGGGSSSTEIAKLFQLSDTEEKISTISNDGCLLRNRDCRLSLDSTSRQ
jgi:hypothetical protein